MKRIKIIISRYLRMIAIIMALLIILLAVLLEGVREQQITRVDTKKIFSQVENMLEENSRELEAVRDEYSEECLANAETIAYIIQNNPSVLDNIEELKHIADLANVDEIHVFNQEGVLYNGTHPEYYGLSVEDGEQIGFFKSMLSDKSLMLVQPLMPNTAEGKFMQYSAVWSSNGEFFVQVGMEQERVQKVTAKNELPYIFSLLRVSSKVSLYAVDRSSGEIIGSTVDGTTGKKLSEIGISLEKATSDPDGFHTVVEGQFSFCIFADCGDSLIGRVIAVEEMYKNVNTVIIVLAVGIVSTVLIMVLAVMHFISREVIAGIDDINGRLAEISEGNLDERVNVSNCLEFSELSKHINEMIGALLSSTDKISYVLDKAGLQIGVYEYHEKMKAVRFTQKVSKILELDEEETQKFSRDCTLFKAYLDALDPVSAEENIFRLCGDTEKYIKFEEFLSGNSILGIIMDITEEYCRCRQLEQERDVDVLTGLLNRRGLRSRMDTLFRQPARLGCGALVMLDADGLKQINDHFGHDAGDVYLKGIAKILISFGAENCLCARQGGDEFVLFLYGMKNNHQVEEQVQRLSDMRRECRAEVIPGQIVSVNFSFGVSLLDGSSDYDALLKEADGKMYESKRQRKQNRI